MPQVPGLSGLLNGLNAGVSFSGLHDSQTGWATVMQPAVGYAFNSTYSLDVTVPIYVFRLAEDREANPLTGLLLAKKGDPGDIIFGLHGQFAPRFFTYQVTVSASAPTGDISYGLSTGRPTFDLSNRFEHAFRFISPTVEIGVGDSSSLVNQLVERDFTSLGPLAHFQGGLSMPLPFGVTFETNAYEQLPLGDQKLYKQIGDRDGPGPSQVVVTGRNVSEDNGFTNVLAVPLNGHTTLTGYYNRSLRLRDDVVSVGLTYVLRSSRESQAAKDEKLLRAVDAEIEKNVVK